MQHRQELLWLLTGLIGLAAGSQIDIWDVTGRDSWEATVLRYDPQKPSGPTEVRCSVVIHELRDISASDHSFGAEITLKQLWKEPKLSATYNETYRVIDATRIWTPDTFFSNALDGKCHSLTKDNLNVQVYPSGHIHKTQRLSLKMSCPMELQAYPFDSPVCSLVIESYGYVAEMLNYVWHKKDPVSVETDLMSSEYELSHFQALTQRVSSSSGNYSLLRIDLHLNRRGSRYVHQIFVPLTILSVIAWFTFWIRDAPVRTTMIMFVLSLAVLSASTLNRSLPYSRSTTMIDYFTGTTVAFITAALVEFVVVNWRRLNYEKDRLANRLDCTFRLLYPVTYIGFIIVFITAVFFA